MQRDIVLTWFYPHSPEAVWECLADSQVMGQWFMKNDFKPVAGARFRFEDTPRPAFKWNGIVYCEVLEIVPLRRIKYTWQSGPEEGVITMDTTVTWTLEPKDGGTQLTLEHRGFRGMKNYLASLMMEKGWKKNGDGKFLKLLQSRDK